MAKSIQLHIQLPKSEFTQNLVEKFYKISDLPGWVLTLYSVVKMNEIWEKATENERFCIRLEMLDLQCQTKINILREKASRLEKEGKLHDDHQQNACMCGLF
jgi:hypothetical protein